MENEMTTSTHFNHRYRRMAQGVLAISLVLIGVLGFSKVASAHDDAIVGVASCSSPLGTGYTVSWTVSNDWDQNEAGTVTSVTGGRATLDATTFNIAAQDDAFTTSGTNQAAALPYLTAASDAEASGSRRECDHVKHKQHMGGRDERLRFRSGRALRAALWGPPQPRPPCHRAGHSPVHRRTYLPLQQRTSNLDRSARRDVGFNRSPDARLVAEPPRNHERRSGRIHHDGNAPSGFCAGGLRGSLCPAIGGNAATEGVTVPAGGNGVGIFYVTNSAPAVTLVKSAAESSYDAAGQTINYNYLITDTGNVALANVGIIDSHPGLKGLSCPDATLAPSAAETCAATYQVTPADLAARSIVNTATAQGTPPGAATPISSSPSSVTVPLAAIGILKQVCGTEVAADCGAGGRGPWTSSADIPEGDTAHWKVTVTNTGDIPLAECDRERPVGAGMRHHGSHTRRAGVRKHLLQPVPHHRARRQRGHRELRR